MRVLIVDTVYPDFLNWLYNEREPGLANRSFAEQYRAQVNGFFHTAGAWAPALRRLGHEVLDVSADNPWAQMRWMIENDLLDRLKQFSDGLVFGNLVLPQRHDFDWQVMVVAEQVKRFRPDVLLCANLYMFDDRFLALVAGHYGVAVGQHAAVMPANSLKRYDLIISSLPNQVKAFADQGIRSALVGLAFDERLLPHLPTGEREHDLAFLGQVTPSHEGRARFLARIAEELPITLWGSTAWPAGIDPARLKLDIRPPKWGLSMYQTIRQCRKVLNYHLDAAGDYANNLRLFEVTGVGSLLVTDNKRNIRDYFEPDQEIVTYDNAADCVAKLKDLARDPERAEQIARAGQARVLKDHTYHNRVHDLLALLG